MNWLVMQMTVTGRLIDSATAVRSWDHGAGSVAVNVPLTRGEWVRSWSINWPHCIRRSVQFSLWLERWLISVSDCDTSRALGNAALASDNLGLLTPANETGPITMLINSHALYYRLHISVEWSFPKPCRICPNPCAGCCYTIRPSSGRWKKWRNTGPPMGKSP